MPASKRTETHNSQSHDERERSLPVFSHWKAAAISLAPPARQKFCSTPRTIQQINGTRSRHPSTSFTTAHHHTPRNSMNPLKAKIQGLWSQSFWPRRQAGFNTQAADHPWGRGWGGGGGGGWVKSEAHKAWCSIIHWFPGITLHPAPAAFFLHQQAASTGTHTHTS